MIMKKEAESLKKEAELLKEELDTKSKMLRVNLAESERLKKIAGMKMFSFVIIFYY